MPGPIDATLAQCLIQQAGFKFAVLRGWHSTGHFDDTLPSSAAALWDAGAAFVSAYVFPCRAVPAKDTIAAFLGNVSASGTKLASVYLDIEENPSTGCGWGSDLASNCAYIAELGEALSEAGVAWGTYATPFEWSTVAGAGCLSGATHPLWYVNITSGANETFSDYVPFGGWSSVSSVAMKQWDWYANPCGINVDSDWMPG